MKKGILACLMLVLGIALGVIGTNLFTSNSYEKERNLLEYKMDQLCADMLDLQDIELSMMGMEDEYIKEFTQNENHSQAEWSRIGMNLEAAMNERAQATYRALRNDITEVQPLLLNVETSYKKHGMPGDEAIIVRWSTDLQSAKNLLESVDGTMQRTTRRYISETEPLMHYADSVEMAKHSVETAKHVLELEHIKADSTKSVQ